MSPAKIGVDVDDFRLPPKEALHKAAEWRFREVELATVAGELAPENLSSSGRQHLARYVDNLGLELTALVADLPGLRLSDPRTVDERVERTCRILELAAGLKVSTVTASSGTLTHPEAGDPSPLALEALERIGEFADVHGVVYALRPAADMAKLVARVLDTVGCPALQLCVDPAAMVMAGANPVALIEQCAGQIALVHARDGTVGLSERAGRETRLGDGDVDLTGLFSALRDTDYHGTYIIRRTDCPDPIPDIEHARQLLARHLH